MPDGALATLPFETLPLETSTGATDRGFLVEHFAIDYLQDAIRLLEPPAQAGNQAVLALGDIDYGAPGTTADAEPRGLPQPFSALPHTRAELEALAVAAGDTPCLVLRGTDASETRLRELASGATVLHLATHGYFAGDAGASGIALAGANLTASNNSDDDGILSPDEALLLDLRECRLVVLSACQSGLGTPFVGESLLGIRRNLHLAGAATTITSLWAVGDQATALLMADLHHALLQQGMTPAAALRHAQLAALARARAEFGEGLPGRWGAFVCDGR